MSLMDDVVNAPWSEEDVKKLNQYQINDHYHPYTCDEGHVLVATTDGWICSEKENGCEYRQNWFYQPTTDLKG